MRQKVGYHQRIASVLIGKGDAGQEIATGSLERCCLFVVDRFRNTCVPMAGF